jgi:hypothetical protein
MKVSFLWASVCAVIFGLIWLLVLAAYQLADLAPDFILGYLVSAN